MYYDSKQFTARVVQGDDGVYRWVYRMNPRRNKILQTIDGYILKPKLFGDSLGVSGLWILVGVIVGGRAFGVVGILLAIPAVAILDFLYREHFLPWLEARPKD